MKPTTIDKLEPIGAAKPTNLGIFDVLYSGRWNKTNKTDNFFSVFATLAYSLKNRYVLNVNVRNDASNRFGQDVNNRVDQPILLVFLGEFLVNLLWKIYLALFIT